MLKQAKRLYEFGPFRLDTEECDLLRDGQPVPLTPKAYETLVLLVENNGRTLSKDELMRAIWPETFVEEANLAHNISLLRKALGESPSEQHYIQTVPRRGYRFVATVRQVKDERLEVGVAEPPLTGTPGEEKQETDFQVGGATTGGAQVRRRGLRLSLFMLCVVLIGAGIVALYRWALPASPPTPIRALAVLPFKPLAANDRDESLELGMADTLIAKLSSVREIVVRPITAVRKYSGLEQDAVAAGRELGVEAVLDGSLQRAGERVRVQVRLLSVADGRQLWAGRFDEAFTDIFAVQDAISERVAASLAPKLGSNEQEGLAKRYTEDSEAYQEYVKGRYHWNKRTGEGFQQAIKHFQRAIEIDPEFALAYAGLADCYNLLGGYLLLPPKESYPLGKAAATRALSIDGSLPEAHVALGFVKARYEWDRAGAETEFQRAIELNRGYAVAHSWYALFNLTAAGRVEEANREAQRAEQLDPVSIGISGNVGWVFYFSRQYEQAIDQSRKVLVMDQSFNQAYVNLGMSLIQRGMYAEAVAACEEGLRYRTDDPFLLGILGFAHGVSGQEGKAREVIERMKGVEAARYFPPTIWARVYTGLSERDRALEWLEKGYEERDDMMLFLNCDPMWDSLRFDPKFANLLQRIGPTDAVTESFFSLSKNEIAHAQTSPTGQTTTPAASSARRM